MGFRILHIPTGRYFGHNNKSVSSSINAMVNTYITVSLKELKLGTSGGVGKIWTRKKYAEEVLKKLKEINSTDWKLEEF